jgi:subtilisin family serine protease
MYQRNKSKYVLLLLLGLMLALSLNSVASAQEGRRIRPINSERHVLTRETASRLAGNAVRLPDGRVQVIVTLSQQPAVTAFINGGGRSNRASADAAAVSQRAVIQQQQTNFASLASGLGAEVFSRTNYLTNSVTLRVNPSQLLALSSLPDVVRIDPDRIIERQDTVSVPFIGSGEVWSGIGGGTGYTGAGQVIAVIDSGIDYIHTHFGGSGNYADNPSTTNGTDSTFFPAAFPLPSVGAPKVVGGYDYVGDNFDSSGDQGSPVAAPDADPIDCAISLGGGHGTHVAGTTAGYGVDADGDTYTGPFEDTIFTDFPGWTESFRIGPGVAPEAALIAMRIFGCNGSTFSSLVAQAMDDAVAGTYGPAADVINMSLGSGYGTADPNYVENVAVANASAAGTVVVMSAGNNGNFFFISGSPGAANEGLAVASSADPGNQARGILNNSNGEVYEAVYGASSPFIHDPVTAPIQRPSPNPDGCLPSDFATFTAGNIALIDRGGCNFSVKQDNAFLAGAAGVIVANVASSPDPETPISMAGAEVPGYNIPTVHVGFSTGEVLRAAANGTNTVTMDWTLAVSAEEEGDTLSSFSSRGPTRQNMNSFKPDLAAPGNTILSAGSGTGEFTYNLSGTSMAAPHVAGAMALLKEKYPDWSVEDLKALVMNTAVNNVIFDAEEDINYGPQRVGSGRVDLVNAFSGGEVVAYNTVNPAGVSVSFAFPEVVAGTLLNETRTITLENKTATPVTYDVEFVQGTDMVGVTLDVTENTVTVPANGTATVTVTLTGDPAAPLAGTNSDPTLDTAFRHFLMEESGWVDFIPTVGSDSVLRVGVYAAPRAVSDMSGSIAGALEDGRGSTTIDLTGTELVTGEELEDLISVVSGYELVATSPDEPNTPNNADIEYFGITSDYVSFGEGEGYVYFGVATHDIWNSPNEITVQVYIDPDFDGDADFILFNNIELAGEYDSYTFDVFDVNGILIGTPAVFTGPYINFFPGDVLNTYLLNSDVMMLPFPMESLIGTGGFNYWVETYSARYEDPVTELGLVVDTVGSATAPLSFEPESTLYDITDASGTLPGFPVTLDFDGFSLDLAYNFPFGEPVPAPDVLLLHHHNASGNRAEVVDVVVPSPAPFQLVSPPSGTVLDTTAEALAFTSVVWTVSADAETYSFELDKPGGDTVLLTGLTPAADTDSLVCDATNCTLTVADPLNLLDENGQYSWNVYAFIGAGFTAASNSPFTFDVNLPVPVPFALVSPMDGSLISDPASVTAITWTASDVGRYNFVLLKISNNPRSEVGEVLNVELTAVADADPLACVAETNLCTLTVDAATQALLSDGLYSWTVVALGTEDVEASNAAFTFRVNTGDIELLVNGGFETAGNAANAAANWQVKRRTGDNRKDNPAKAYEGNAYFQFKGVPGERSVLQQKVNNNPVFAEVGVVQGDVLNASLYVDTNIAAAGRVTIKVKYATPTAGPNGNGKQKVNVDLVATTGYQPVTATLTAADAITGLNFQVKFNSNSGKARVDAASLIRAGAVPGVSGVGAGEILELPLPLPSGPGN